MHLHIVYPKWKDESGPSFVLLLLMLSSQCLTELVEAQDSAVCGERLSEVLKTICLNGYNTKDLGGPIRYRRQSEVYMPKYIYSKQYFVPPTMSKHKLTKSKPSFKQTLKMEARWQQNSQMRGKRVRRQDDMDPAERIKKGIVDDCCKKGCPYSTIEKYCKELDKLTAANL